jgi:SAM-dependent methyltransferase
MTLPEQLHTTQDFFGSKAAGWEERFPDDGPRYARAVAELDLAPGALVLDLGCGTGRALLPARAGAGPQGRVLGLDATLPMLREARRLGRGPAALLIAADVLSLPLPGDCANAIFAGGLLPHLADPEAGLREMARVTRAGGRLAVFHPIGRAGLAARHHQTPSDDDVLAPARLARLCSAAGWQLVSVDDAGDRYLALARRL